VAAALVLALGGGAAVWFLRQPAEQAAESKGKNQPPADVTPPPGMAYVPGGEFMMGSDAGDEYERPQHKVTVKPFFIDLYEVTCEDYQKFILATNHQAPSNWIGGRYPPGAMRRPVTGVTWDDAVAYAAWIGKRLPTEQEWEFAARGAEGRCYPWGNEWKSGLANADTSSLGHLADVGAYSSGTSPFGLFDLVGNAWEWTTSDLTAYPGGQLPKQSAEDLKVIRGGYWKSNLNQATTTFRRGIPARGDYEYDNTGFRCAKDAGDSSGTR
jgi:formylglycine-generating enzyme required for sulfatase activity